MADIDNNKLMGLLTIAGGSLSFSQEHINSFMRGWLSYRNQSIDLQSKSMDWLLCNNCHRHERVKEKKNLRIRKRDSTGAYYSITHDLSLNDKEDFRSYLGMNISAAIPIL